MVKFLPKKALKMVTNTVGSFIGEASSLLNEKENNNNNKNNKKALPK